MRLPRLTSITLMLCAVSACVSAPSPDAQRAALAEANRRYDEALLDADGDALEDLYADEFRYFGPNDVVRDKSTQIAVLTSGAVDLIEGRSSEVDIRIYGVSAVVTGRFAGRVRVDGREFSFTERYSTVWVNRQERWRLVLEHGSVVETNK
jgi:ketosteroid isomerase-like protein